MTDEPWWHEPGAPGSEQLGSAAEEAGRLFQAMRDRMLADPAALRVGMRLMEAVTALSRSGGTPVAPGQAPECAYCPVCQAIARARTLSPETVERLTGVAMEFAETVRQVVTTTEEEAADHLRHVPLDDDAEQWLANENPDKPDERSAPGADEADTPATPARRVRRRRVDRDADE